MQVVFVKVVESNLLIFTMFHVTCNALGLLLYNTTKNIVLTLINCCEDCFYYCLERNNVAVLFGTLKVQSFLLTEVSDCGLLIVVTSSAFLKRKDMLKEKSS